jgi:hypothetical protein
MIHHLLFEESDRTNLLKISAARHVILPFQITKIPESMPIVNKVNPAFWSGKGCIIAYFAEKEFIV